MTDIIGDIHGYADTLAALLQKMGYEKNKGVYAHPERKVLFVGDYIDRGHQIKETLAIVRAMVDTENAVALMGNHEYNAVCFHFQETEGGHLRKHDIKNIIQHYETLKQFQNRQSEYEDYIDWFKTLPLYYETEHFRAVHACWDASHIQYLRQHLKDDRLTYDLIYQSVAVGTPLNEAVDVTLKVKELKMPEGLFFKDKDGTKRTDIRIIWWENPATMTYQQISVEKIDHLPDSAIDINNISNSDYYREDDKPVFFGHYWLKGQPVIYRNNICCLDYSVAKGGHLVAYRFDDEKDLDNAKLVYV